MPRHRVLAPLLALLALDCSGGEANTSGFVSGQGTGPGPVSFGTSDSSGAPTTTDPGTSSSSTSTTDPGTSTTDESTTSVEPDTDSSGSTGPAPASCGDGIVQDGEHCDEGADSEDCLADCTAAAAVLALVGRGTASGSAATFTPGPGWKLTPLPIGVAAADLEATPGGAMAVIRRASATLDEQNELYFARWQPANPSQFTMTAKVGVFGFAKGAPAIAPVADTVSLTFLGSDNKHYTALHTADLWSPFGPLPAGMIQLQAFGPGPAGLAARQAETYAVYVGDDAQLYYNHKPAPGSSWGTSTGAPPLSILPTVSPVALIDDQSDLIVAYARSDHQIALIKLLTPMNAWTAEVLLHPQARTDAALALIRLDAGNYALAWRDLDTQTIFLARSNGPNFDSWTAPLTVDLPAMTSSPPVLVPGLPGAELEIFFTSAGKLRHARLAADLLVAPVEVPGITAASTVAAARVSRKP